MKPNVSIIILNWNGWKDTIECLESLYQNHYPNYEIILIDNASSDNSINKIKEYCKNDLKVHSNFLKYNPRNKPISILEVTSTELDKKESGYFFQAPQNQRLIIIKNDKNYGFAEGNNIGIRFVLKNLDSDYILLLNNDTITDENFLNELINTARKNPHTGIIGSVIYLYNDPQSVQSAGVKIKWHLGETKPIKYPDLNEESFDAVSGCSMLIKKDVIKKNGILNSKCFLYYEDIDLCLRAKNSGFNITVAHKSKVFHKTSVSSKKITGTREYYSARNLFYIMKKYSKKNEYYFFLVFFFSFKIWFTIATILLYHKELSAFIPYLKGVFKGLTL